MCLIRPLRARQGAAPVGTMPYLKSTGAPKGPSRASTAPFPPDSFVALCSCLPLLLSLSVVCPPHRPHPWGPKQRPQGCGQHSCKACPVWDTRNRHSSITAAEDTPLPNTARFPTKHHSPPPPGCSSGAASVYYPPTAPGKPKHPGLVNPKKHSGVRYAQPLSMSTLCSSGCTPA